MTGANGKEAFESLKQKSESMWDQEESILMNKWKQEEKHDRL